MKKYIALLLIFIMLPLTGCKNTSAPSDKIKITATLFPQYDFARQIGGDLTEVNLLLPPGQDSHHYDPSPSDMVSIAESNLFIYTGSLMEGWAGNIAKSISSSTAILDVSENIELYGSDHEETEYSDHSHSLDPHIWLDFDNAKIMAENIAAALSAISPENAAYFNSNLEGLLNELSALDEEYRLALSAASKPLIFGGRFALGYLVRSYNINYKSAYDSCSANSEPSAQDIAALCDYIAENDIHVVYCEEFSDPKVARELAKANNAEVLVLHSAHNISLEERESGATFISIMKQNLENIRKGLN